MQVQRIQNNNTNFNFGSRVIKTKKFIEHLSKESKEVQDTFNRHINKLKKNGNNDTVLMCYDENPTFPERNYNYFLTVFTNDGNPGGKYQSISNGGEITPHEWNVDIAYLTGKELLMPADENLIRKYNIKFEF